MKRNIVRYLILTTAALGLAQGSLFAADGYWDRLHDRNDLRHDYARVDRQNADIHNDLYRRNEALEHGNYGAASRIQADINRDRAARDRQVRDIRHDRRDLYRDRWER